MEIMSNQNRSEHRDHLILISGGLASFELLCRVIAKYGKSRVRLWFFDTLIEDQDLYRFLQDIESHFDIQIERFQDGRNPWQVFYDERFIGNSRADVCSKHLKRKFLERELRRRYPGGKNVILYFGLDWSEKHRINAMKPKWEDKGFKLDFPLLEDPLLFHDNYISNVEDLGIRPPRLYKLGFPHNNCGGACVKAGIRQWRLLLEQFPERYYWHEVMEQELRKHLGKNVSILRNRNGGQTRPMTLRFLRWRLQQEARTGIIGHAADDTENDTSCTCFINMLELSESEP